MEPLADRLKHLRIRIKTRRPDGSVRPVRQYELADHFGIPIRTWSKYETGSQEPAEWVSRLLLDALERLADQDQPVELSKTTPK